MKGEFSNKEKRKHSPLVGVEYYPLDEEVAGGLSQDTSSPYEVKPAFFGRRVLNHSHRLESYQPH